MKEAFDEPDELDGYEELPYVSHSPAGPPFANISDEYQAKIKKAWQTGHVDPADVPESAKQKSGDEDDGDGSASPKKKTPKKAPAKKAPTKKTKKKADSDDEDEDEDASPKKKPARKAATKAKAATKSRVSFLPTVVSLPAEEGRDGERG